jgi:hypothetical protein
MAKHDAIYSPISFEPIADGRKRFVYHREPEGWRYEIGDWLYIEECRGMPPLFRCRKPSHRRTLDTEITYVCRGPESGVPVGYVILSLGEVHVANTEVEHP